MNVGPGKWGLLLLISIKEARPSFGVLLGVKPFGLHKVLDIAEEHGLLSPAAGPLDGRGSITLC